MERDRDLSITELSPTVLLHRGEHHMANNDRSPWYVLGQALGGAGNLVSNFTSNPSGGSEDPGTGGGGGGGTGLPAPLTGTLAGAAGTILLTALERWLGKRRPPFRKLLRGAVAGAGAAGIVAAARVLVDQDDELDLMDELLAGAGKGVIYAALLEPFMPGPPVLRGSLAGSLDYLASPAGGVFSRLQSLSPARKLPLISVLLEAGDAEDDPYLAFLLHGAALGLLYGEPDEESDD
jgi:hypothetical protein